MESVEQIAQRMGYQRLLIQLDDVAAIGLADGSGVTSELAQCATGFFDAAALCPATLELLMGGWSSEAPRIKVTVLRQLLLAALTSTSALQEAAVMALAAVSTAKSEGSVALAAARARMPQVTLGDANAAVLAEALGVVMDITGSGALPGVSEAADAQFEPGVFQAQRLVLDELQSTMDGVIADWDSAMRTAIAALDVRFPEFTATVAAPAPLPCGPAIGLPAQSPSQIDANLRADLAADLASTDPTIKAFAEAVQADLDKAEAQAGKSYLLVYAPNNPAPQGGVAIGVGDLESADHILLMAGGIGTGPGTIPGDIDDATAILAAADLKDPEDISAAIVYAGYDAPFGVPFSVGGAVGEAKDMSSMEYVTMQGEVMNTQLAPILNGLKPGADLTALLHSFGTTVGTAAIVDGLAVDQVIYTGSPGVGYTSADRLPIDPALQFVAANANDPVVNQDELLNSGLTAAAVFTGGLLTRMPDVLGPNPADPEYGAQVIDQESGLPLLEAHATTAYLTPDGIDNVAAILTEQYDDVEIVGEN